MKNKGITLVALVVTIIILLILAGITISQLTGSGLFENARLAEQKSKEAQEQEDETLSDYENKIGEYISNNRETVTVDKERFEAMETQLATLTEQFNNLNSVIGTTQTAIGTVTPSAQTITEICSITLNEGNYIILGEVTEDDSYENWIYIYLNGTDFVATNNTKAEDAYKRVNAVGYVSVASGSTKTITLRTNMKYSYSVTGKMTAIRIK